MSRETKWKKKTREFLQDMKSDKTWQNRGVMPTKLRTCHLIDMSKQGLLKNWYLIDWRKCFHYHLPPNLVYVNSTQKTAVIWIAIDLFSFRSCSVLYSLLTVMNEWLFPDQLEIDIGQLNVLNVFCMIANVISFKRNIIGFSYWNSIPVFSLPFFHRKI